MAGVGTELAVINNMSGALTTLTDNICDTAAAYEHMGSASKFMYNSSNILAMAQEMQVYEQSVEELQINFVNVNGSLEEMGEKTEKVSQSGNRVNSIFNKVSGAIKKIDVQKILNTSDEFVQTTAKLDMMNDGLLTTDQLAQKIYASAKNARGSFSGMTDFVTQMGTRSGDSFGSTEEIVAFGNLLQKQMTIAGASTAEASDMMNQLAQSSELGVLGGSELNSIFEQMPNMVQSVADYLDMPVEKVSELASQGNITTEVLKNAMFASADEINAKFAEMPVTWDQIWQSMQDTALNKFQLVLQKINDMANSAPFQALISGAMIALGITANVVGTIFDLLGTIAQYVYDNWSVIGPVIYGVIAALGIYTLALFANSAMQTVNSIQKKIAEIQEYAHAAAIKTEASETEKATVVQKSFNTTLLASPITWITIAIIALIAVIVILANWIAKTTEGVDTGFGVICGWVNVGIQAFKNLGLMVANIAIGIWNAMGACAANLNIAFGNAIYSIQSLFYNLLSTALFTIAGIAEELNKLPFVDIDYSGVIDKANEFAVKAAEAENKKQEYKDVGKAFNQGANTFKAFEDGWVDDAFDSGAAWGDGVAGKFGDWLSSFNEEEEPTLFTPEDSGIGLDSENENLSRIADDTSNISNSLDISNENLKFLRDIAERDAVNRFTTSEIKIDMTNHNSISSNMDLDGIINHVVTGVKDAMVQTAEGVNRYGI